jgi:hypothetical protein
VFEIVIRHLPLHQFNPIYTITPSPKISFQFTLQSVPIFTQVIIRPDSNKIMYFSTPVYGTSDPPSFNHPNTMQIFGLFKNFLFISLLTPIFCSVFHLTLLSPWFFITRYCNDLKTVRVTLILVFIINLIWKLWNTTSEFNCTTVYILTCYMI